jgi:hypothetical protein
MNIFYSFIFRLKEKKKSKILVFLIYSVFLLLSNADGAKKLNGPTVDIIRSAPDSNVAFPWIINVNNSYRKPCLYR